MKKVLMLLPLIASCGPTKVQVVTQQPTAIVSTAMVDLCPGKVVYGWGGSDLSSEYGFISKAKLYADIQTNSGLSLGLTAVPSAVFCDEVDNLPTVVSGVNTIKSDCDADTNIATVNGRRYHLGTGNFATIMGCAFKHINDTKHSVIIVQRMKPRVVSEGCATTTDKPLRPCQDFEVLDEIRVTY